MIIPAAISKIIGFKKTIDGERFSYPTEGANIAQLQLDNGKLINVTILSTDKNYSDSLSKFLESKVASVMKESEVKQGALDLAFDDSGLFDNLIEKYTEIIKGENNSELTGKKLQQEIFKRVAYSITYDKRLIKQKSVIKLAIATSENESSYNSKSITVVTDKDGGKSFGRSGLSYFAQTANAIPVEITSIKNASNEFVGYFKVSTCNLITLDQINFLINHSIRTIQSAIMSGKKPFLLRINYSQKAELSKIINELITIEKNNKGSQSVDVYERYKILLEELKLLLNTTPSLCNYFKAELPFLITESKMSKLITDIDSDTGQSALQKLSQSIPALNFSSENPDIKNEVAKFVSDYINNISNGVTSCKIISTFNLQAPNIFGEASTWGFPDANISGGKFTLSYDETKKLIEDADFLVKELKSKFN